MTSDQLITRLNTFWWGLVIGLLSPVLCFFLYWLVMYHYISFPQRFFNFLLEGRILSEVLKICAIGNLLIFFFAMKKMNNASRGLIVATILYVLLIVYLSFIVNV